MKRTLALGLALILACSLTACGKQTGEQTATPAPEETVSSEPAEETPEETETTPPVEETEPEPEDTEPAEPEEVLAETITLWTTGGQAWNDREDVEQLLAAFQQETGVTVEVEYRNETASSALSSGKTPDVILGTPEDLVNTWGISETLVDLSDLLDEQDEVELNKTALTACQTETGKLFAYPLAANIHCMAVNYTALQAAGAEQLVNLDTRTWTTEEFCQAVTALYAYEGATVAPVYCGSISGDQGTRGLVTNLYDGSFTNASQTAYTWDGEEMQQALLTLSQLDGITIDSGLSSGDAIELFRDGTFQMSFCWNSDQQKKVRSGSTGVTDGGDQIEWMAFPSEDGQPQLESTLWSVGVFDNGDETKVAAAKRLVQFLCDSAYTGDAVRVTGYCAVRETAEDCDLTHVWDDDPVMSGFSNLLADLGDYVPLTPGWEEARDAWQTALMSIGAGADVASALEDGCAQSNSAMG